MLQNGYLVAEVGADRAEHEPYLPNNLQTLGKMLAFWGAEAEVSARVAGG